MGSSILIADDHPLFRAALRSAISAAVADAAFTEADSISALFESLERDPHADLLLLDLNIPGAQGLSALAHLRGNYPQLPIVVVSALDDALTVRQCLRFGAQGFISKSADAVRIGADVHSLLEGELVAPEGTGVGAGTGAGDAADGSGPDVEVARRLADLTPQQFRVLGMLCAGRMNKQIGYELQISEATVKAHMTALLRKLGVGTRTQAVLLVGRMAVQPGGMRPPPEEP